MPLNVSYLADRGGPDAEKRGIKTRIKCSECPHLRFLPVTDDAIRWHLIPSCIHKDTNINSLRGSLRGGRNATTSTFSRRDDRAVTTRFEGSPQQGRISAGAVFVAARGVGVKRQSGRPSPGMATDLGAASAGPILAARRSSLAAPEAGRATPPEPARGGRGTTVGGFSGARRTRWVAGGEPGATGL